jgi:CheY-like chemotaxis protein
MPPAYRITLLGFSAFEKGTLASCFRLAAPRAHVYALLDMPSEADFIVANADQPAAVQLVLATERQQETVFIGQAAPPGATAWMPRPIDPLHVMRELDAMVALAEAAVHRGTPATTAGRPMPPAAAPAQAPQPRLPRVPGTTPVPALPGLVPSSDGHPGGGAALQALLVDDSEIALHYLARRLQRWGVQAWRAEGSQSALALLAGRRFALVFIDVELGQGSHLDGLALCQELRRRYPAHDADAPVLALISAHASELDRVRGTLAGADAYLGKPLDEVELARLLRRQGLRPPPAEAGAAGMAGAAGAAGR